MDNELLDELLLLEEEVGDGRAGVLAEELLLLLEEVGDGTAGFLKEESVLLLEEEVTVVAVLAFFFLTFLPPVVVLPTVALGFLFLAYSWPYRYQ